jgi:RNA polymerase sigma factor (TIGR02999 family)
MRQILVDASRRRAAVKRAGDIEIVEVDENLEPLAWNYREMVALDDALNELAVLNSQHAKMVDLHFFGGLSWQEVANGFSISIATVEHDWKAVRRFLLNKIRRA